jgi:uncharacterized protein with von Willebrand factor type A (vWA) domain
MAFIPKPHEIYKHFKGNLYQIVAVAQHTETGEQLVIYQALYGDFKIYARPLDMFTSRVDRKKYPDAAQEFRFELQGAEAARQKQESPKEHGFRLQQETAEAPQVSQEYTEEQTAQEEPALDPLVLEFLDADSYEQRLNILAGIHHRVTDEMITTMAIACDVEIEEGDTEERYESLKSCLLTLEKYECNRMR